MPLDDMDYRSAKLTNTKIWQGDAGNRPVEVAMPAAGVPTMEFFAPVTYSDPAPSAIGDYPGPLVGATGKFANIVFHVPGDFSSITNAELIGIAKAGDGSKKMNITLDSDYAAVGEAKDIHSETSASQDSIANCNDDDLIAWDISTVLSVLAAGDYVGIKASYVVANASLGTNAYILGVRFKYA